jgi:hypothetical protein
MSLRLKFFTVLIRKPFGHIEQYFCTNILKIRKEQDQYIERTVY